MPSTRSKVTLTLAISAVLLMILEWILLVAGTRPDEMIVGAASIVISAIFLAQAHKSSTLKLNFHLSDIATGWRIPWYVVSDCFALTRILLRDLFTAHRAGSHYRVSGFKTIKDDPRLIARGVLATLYTTTSPNSIVIGIDYKQSRMLFHQLERSPVSTMTKHLGANS